MILIYCFFQIYDFLNQVCKNVTLNRDSMLYLMTICVNDRIGTDLRELI